jgi:hypothetical protein
VGAAKDYAYDSVGVAKGITGAAKDKSAESAAAAQASETAQAAKDTTYETVGSIAKMSKGTTASAVDKAKESLAYVKDTSSNTASKASETAGGIAGPSPLGEWLELRKY